MTTYALERLADERLAALRLEAARYRTLPRRTSLPAVFAGLRSNAGMARGRSRRDVASGGPAGCCA